MSQGSTGSPSPIDYASQPMERTLFGHPRGLFVLFSTELWERFSFYSMRGIMTLYMVNIVLAHMTAEKGKEASGGFADQVYGAYLGFVYASTFIGGMLADRLLGQRRAIYIGGVLMSLAHFTLTTHALLTGTPDASYAAGELNYLFYGGLGLLACGNGFFKPNISTIVGTLYRPEDARRDSAFTIFYMGINIGATLSSFSSGAGQKWGWYIGYLAAGIGMILSLAVIFLGRDHIRGKGLPPSGATLIGKGRFGMPNAVPLLLGSVAFIVVASYLMSRPEWVQSLAHWIGVIVLFYLTWEAARIGQAHAASTVHMPAVVGALAGFFALAAYQLFEATSQQDQWSGVMGWFAGQRQALYWASICGLVVALACLVNLIVRGWKSEEGGRMIVIVTLCVFSMVFWGFYELQGSTIIRFADLQVNMWIFNYEMPTAWVANFVNPFLVILLGIPFSWLWVWLDRRNMEPSTPLKFSLGLAQLALGFLMLWIGANQAQHGGKASLIWLLLAIFFFTSGEMCLSPVGLSMVTKLSPARFVGVFMGMWFLSSALANVITGGKVGPLTEQYGFAKVFLGIAALIAASAVLLAILVQPLKRIMHGIK